MTTQYYNIVPGQHIPNVDAGLIYGVVPVQWMSFTGEHMDTYNQLDWTVTNQVDVSHYEIERKLSDSGNFETIGKLLSMGDETEVVDYNYPDYDLEYTGVYYYRIKQIDNDGEYSYTDIIAIDVIVERPDAPAARMYPNPMVDAYTLEVNTFSDNSDINYIILDADGKLVTQQTSLAERVVPGKHIFIMSADKLAPGIYTMRINVGANVITKKMIVVSN